MLMLWIAQYFNSHPHEEDDPTNVPGYIASQNFNSHPHEEDDAREVSAAEYTQDFNSHPHEEDDKLIIPCENID